MRGRGRSLLSALLPSFSPTPAILSPPISGLIPHISALRHGDTPPLRDRSSDHFPPSWLSMPRFSTSHASISSTPERIRNNTFELYVAPRSRALPFFPSLSPHYPLPMHNEHLLPCLPRPLQPLLFSRVARYLLGRPRENGLRPFPLAFTLSNSIFAFL